MSTILNNKELTSPDEILNLALYNYAVYTSFVIHNNEIRYLNHHIDRVSRDANEFLGLDVKK